MRLGLFGGTFDPPHIGHLILTAEAQKHLALDKVMWILTPDPPHKDRPDMLPAQTRLRLVKAAIGEDHNFELSTLEMERQGPHYAVETVKQVSMRYKGASIYYLIGGDSLRDLPTWRDPKELLDLCAGLGVMRRPNIYFDMDILESHLPGLVQKTHFMDVPLIDISSSDIRKRIREGRPYRYFLPYDTFQLITSEKLYLQTVQ